MLFNSNAFTLLTENVIISWQLPIWRVKSKRRLSTVWQILIFLRG